jgi:hypothetical protein
MRVAISRYHGHTISDKATQLRPAPRSRRGASHDIAIQDAEEGAQGGMKWRKQHRQETATVTNDDGGINKQAGGSDMRHAAAAAGSRKC